MKRCSQCHFIYEDDQNLCDMDGSALASEPGLTGQLSSTKASPQNKGPKRSFAFTVIAFVVIGTVLILTYGAMRNRTPSSSETTAAQTEDATTTAAPAISNAPAVDESKSRQTDSSPERSAEPDGVSKSVPSRSARIPQRANTHSKSVEKISSASPSSAKSSQADAKKDSKIETVLKKTGNFFKKPFKR
ncbi:MAG: hypothetical protein ABR555_03780 [Pyrinomonadaceae bacterium]